MAVQMGVVMYENASAYISVTDSGTTFKITHCPFRPPMEQRAVRINEQYYYVPSKQDIREYKPKSEVKGDNVSSVRKSFNRLKAIINANCDDVGKVRFVTVTYADNMTDSKVLYSDMKYFIKRLRDELPMFEYVYVKERQARGAWHVHMLMFFENKAPYIKSSYIAEKWQHGTICNVQAIGRNDVNNVGNYLCAYLTESKGTSVKGARLMNYESGIRLYNCSRGIKRPVKYSLSYNEYVEMVSSEDTSIISQKIIDTEFGGIDAKIVHELYRRI